MKTVLKITLGILLAFGLLGVGCVALIGTAADEVAEDLDEQAAEGISQEAYDAIETGATRESVEDALGEPDSTDETTADVGGDAAMVHECIYYSQKGKLASLYQFCFDDGVLASKSRV